MQVKKVVIASDHAGCKLKQVIVNALQKMNIQVLDLGPVDDKTSIDYPDKAYLLAKALYKKEADRGVLVCGSGIGMSIAANRYAHIRAALVSSPELAKLTRQHNDANVLVLGGRFIEEETAIDCLKEFLNTEFEGGRHASRVEKLGGMPHDFE